MSTRFSYHILGVWTEVLGAGRTVAVGRRRVPLLIRAESCRSGERCPVV